MSLSLLKTEHGLQDIIFFIYRKEWILLKEIGNQLKKAREATGITLDEVSKDLDIKVNVLDNIENGNIGCFKDIYQLKDYIQEYSKYLGLDPEKMANEFNEYLFEYTSKIPVSRIEKAIKSSRDDEKEKISSPYTLDKPKTKKGTFLFIYLLIILLVILAIYWSVNQITVEKKNAYVISYRK